MAGIYIHIPFCIKRCSYCDFYSSTDTDKVDSFIDSLLLEINNRKEELQKEKIDTIYFGGGTPSVLNSGQLNKIFYALKKVIFIDSAQEITLESNPDDFCESFIKELVKTPVNRLSIGIQSFNDHFLKLMNRRHDSAQAIEAVKIAQSYGLDNISIDLIYGLPGLTEEIWKETIETALSLGIQHISAYHLTYEKGTSLYKQLQSGQFKELDEEASIHQFKILIDCLKKEGFQQYEISNFGKENYYSKHNTSYWLDKSYIGLGPSAHSYDGSSRRWNISNLLKYQLALEKKKSYFEIENLTLLNRYNEMLMLGLRTQWGVKMKEVEINYSQYLDHFIQMKKKYLEKKYVFIQEGYLIINTAGRLLTDQIIEEFMVVE